MHSGDHFLTPNGSSDTIIMAHVTYQCLQAILDSIGSLIDGGAIGGLAGADSCMLDYSADIILLLVTCTRTVHTTHGPIVLIMCLYAYYGKWSTIHSIGQLSHFCLDLDDQSSAIPGHQQCMVTPNQWIIPFNIINGLTRMPMQSPTDDKIDNLPHIIITSDDIWDRTVLEHLIYIANDIYHPAMDFNINEEEFTSLNECTSMTGSYLHHDDYVPNYICDVYHN